MRPAAKLDRIMMIVALPHAEHAHFVAVLLTEQRQRARRDGIVGRHQPRRHGFVAANLRVHIRLDLRDLLARQCLGVREVEAEAILDRKSTRLTPVTNAHLVCRLLLEKTKKIDEHNKHTLPYHHNYYSILPPQTN